MSTPSVSALKKSLRTAVRSSLKSLTPATSVEASKKITDEILASSEYKEASNIACFLSMPSGEVDTRDLCASILSDPTKALYVPRVGLDFSQNDMEMVEVVGDSYSVISSWATNKWAIPEPPSTLTSVATPTTLDLVIVPGCAFTPGGRRCGHGRGYYDSYLSKLEKKPALIGVGFECQLRRNEEDVPVEQHDVRMDRVFVG